MSIENKYIRSDKINEIMNRMPKGIILWSSVSMFLFSLILILLSLFIKYPDTIKGEILISTINPTIPIISKANTYIDSIFLKNNTFVKKNDAICLLKNNAENTEIEYLRVFFRNKNLNDVLSADLPELNHLGNLQNSYNTLLLHKRNVSQNSFSNNKNIISYNKEMNVLNNQAISINKNIESAQNSLAILNNQLETKKQLYEKKIISKFDLNSIEQEVLNKKNIIEDLKINLNNIKLRKEDINSSINSIKGEQQESNFNDEQNLLEAFNNLKEQLNTWHSTNIITAPISGILIFNKIWSSNQPIKQGETICTIVPKDNKVIGKMKIEINGASKVQIGQKVKIDVFNYPSNEFGYLYGIVKQKSLIPEESKYWVDIAINTPLISSKKIMFKFYPNMAGSAEIITDNKSIFKRIISL